MYRKNLNLSSAYFEGAETISSSKFNLILQEIKKRITNEKALYNRKEIETAFALLKLANACEILFTTQDNPLYLTQQTPSVNLLAQDIVAAIHKPLNYDEISPRYRNNFDELKSWHDECVRQRDFLLNEFIDVEKFFHVVDQSLNFDLTCLLGVSSRVRNSLENLSRFNQEINKNYQTMFESNTHDSGYRVNLVLDKINTLKQYHKEMFPKQCKLRNDNYEKVFNNVNEQH